MPDRARRPLAARDRKRIARLTTPPETQEQQEFFAWCELWKSRHPELDECYAVPSGGGRSSKAEAGKLQREGVKPGVPDIQLDLARGPYHGWRCEMKRRDESLSKVSPEQARWHERLRARGYRVDVCYGFEQARAAVLAYLALPDPIPTVTD